MPTVILAARAAGSLQVNFLARIDRALTDVANPEIAGRAIKAEPPRVTEAVRPNFRARAVGGDERVARGMV